MKAQHVYYEQLTRRKEYYIQINKEAGLMVHSGIKETGLATMRISLRREAIFRLETLGVVAATVCIFYALY